MNNVIDIMNRHPKYQQAILSHIPVVDDVSSIDTSSFSDSQLIESCVERQFDNNEISEFAENDLKNLKIISYACLVSSCIVCHCRWS